MCVGVEGLRETSEERARTGERFRVVRSVPKKAVRFISACYSANYRLLRTGVILRARNAAKTAQIAFQADTSDYARFSNAGGVVLLCVSLTERNVSTE